MNTPPMGVPASAPVDMKTNDMPTRAPTSSIGEICTTQACVRVRSVPVENDIYYTATHGEERKERA